MALIITIVAFIIILSGLIFVHELGHFLAAKKTGVKVEEFVLGFPPLILKKQIGETLYGIGLIPFGGYNKILGEDANNPESFSNPRSYESQGPMVKFLIISGGVFMNLMLAVAIFYSLAAFLGFQLWQPLLYSDYNFPFGKQQNFPMVAGVFEDSAAGKAGLEARDVILSANGEHMADSQAFVEFISKNQGKEISLDLKNTRTRQEKTATIVLGEKDGEKQTLGVSLSNAALLSYESPFEKISAGFLHSFNLIDFSFSTIGRVIKYSFVQKDAALLGASFVGPVGIYAITKIIIDYGWVEILNFCGLISLALAVTNILPFPAFDGGKLVFILLQSIDKKRFSLAVQYKIEQAGAMFLICLAILITFKDFWFFKDIIFK
ncbi:MAG: site-2 protease family protein [Candidatus Pacebacteria bacterium]|nr:site-2 protease family protein [Candidatus Paceibacterota bacterium]